METTNTLVTSLRSDKRKNPAMVTVQYLTFEEVKALKNHAQVLDRHCKVAEVKITSIKTWKTRPNIVEVHCKYGMYEFFSETVTRETQQTFFVKVISE